MLLRWCGLPFVPDQGSAVEFQVRLDGLKEIREYRLEFLLLLGKLG